MGHITVSQTVKSAEASFTGDITVSQTVTEAVPPFMGVPQAVLYLFPGFGV